MLIMLASAAPTVNQRSGNEAASLLPPVEAERSASSATMSCPASASLTRAGP